MEQQNSVKTEGATIVFERRGSGTPLLMITGAGGSADTYAEIAPLLADAFEVITYDRRCDGRSTGDLAADLDMAQQARDAVAVLQAAGHKKAIVFGNSGGANIALQMASDYPAWVSLFVVHEPPCVNVLKDDGKTVAFVREVHETFLRMGVGAAMKMFATSMVGFDRTTQRPGLGLDKDLPYFFAKEYLNITLCDLDFSAIKKGAVPVAVLAGEDSNDAYYARTAKIVSEKLGCVFIRVPGNHLAMKLDANRFAAALRRVFSKYAPA